MSSGERNKTRNRNIRTMEYLTHGGCSICGKDGLLAVHLTAEFLAVRFAFGFDVNLPDRSHGVKWQDRNLRFGADLCRLCTQRLIDRLEISLDPILTRERTR